MTKPPHLPIPALATLLILAATAYAQQANLHIGYVYPAGARQGATLEAIVAGQFLTGVNNVYVSGGGVTGTVVELIQPTNGKQLNDLRIEMDELLAKKAVVRNDFTTLAKFRSFKNAKNVKTDKAAEDKEIDELKKKYAKASWGPDDEKRLLEIRKKMSMAVRRPANPAISELTVVRITVAADAAPGARELRIATPAGLSNPLAFCVGQLPEFSEKATKSITEQRSAVAKTAYAPKGRKTEADMRITLPAVVNGQILPGAVNRYRLAAAKGQRLVIAASARELIPYIADAVPGWFQATLALYDANGKEVAYGGDYQFNPDPVLFYQVPADGEYVMEIKDSIYRGREDFVYRITVGEVPFVTGIFPLGGPAGKTTSVAVTGWNLPAAAITMDDKDRRPGVYPFTVQKDNGNSNVMPFAVDTLPECLEKEPNNQPSAAQPVTLPVIVNGRIDEPGDWDVFSFQGRAGQPIVAEVMARRLNSPLDSVLKLTDAGGKQIAFNDDHEDKGSGLSTHHADSYLSVTLPADGTYDLHLGDMQHKGGPEYAYRLRISPPRPDFALRAVPSSMTMRAGATVPITVYALRKDGFSGDIRLTAAGAPKGATLCGARVPPNQNRVRLTLTVPPGLDKDLFNLTLEGRATIDGREVSHPVVPAEDMMQAFEYRHLVPAKEWKVAVAGKAPGRAAIRIVGDSPVKIPAGGTVRVQVAAPIAKSFGKIELELSDPPEGITIKSVASSGDGTEIVLASDAAKVKPGLEGNLIVNLAAKNAPAKTGKPGKGPSRVPLATLPAIPFQVVKP